MRTANHCQKCALFILKHSRLSYEVLFTSARTDCRYLWLPCGFIQLSNSFVLPQSTRICTIRSAVRTNVGYMQDLQDTAVRPFLHKRMEDWTPQRRSNGNPEWGSSSQPILLTSCNITVSPADHPSSIFPLGFWNRILFGFFGAFP